MKKIAEDLHMYTKSYNYMRYGSWDMECNRQFFVIMGYFLPFYPAFDPES